MRAMKDSGIAWIGEIPSNKCVIRNKYLLEYTKGKLPVDTNYEGMGFPYIGATDLDSNEPCKTYTNDRSLPDSCDSDLLVLWDGARAGLCGIHKIGKISSTIVRIREVDSTIYRPFLYWYYKGFEDYMYQRVNGTTIPHMNRKYIEEIQMIDWTIQEQHRIADYLDRKCSQIDAIIARQQEVIEKLKAYKLSVITEAVTKGLNPHAPMKDSGVEWIGEIPEQWKVAKLKFVASFYNGDRSSKYPSGTDIVDEGVIFVASNNLGNTFLDTTISTKYITKEKYDDLGGAKIRINDIIFCLRGSVGKCSINKSENEGTIASSLVVIRAKKILADYLIFALQCPGITAVSTLNAIGIGSLNLSADDISEIFIPIPPEKEAAEIAEFLYKRIGKIDHVINEKNNYVNHFVMYKKSLIYEVATGKKEV